MQLKIYLLPLLHLTTQGYVVRLKSFFILISQVFAGAKNAAVYYPYQTVLEKKREYVNFSNNRPSMCLIVEMWV